MKRLIWISVGVGITIYVLRKVNKVNEKASQFTPAGIASAAAGLTENVRNLGIEFRESMKEHEARLTEALLERNTEKGWGIPRSGTTPLHPEYDLDEDDPEEYF